MKKTGLVIEGLRAGIPGKEILHGLDLHIPDGEVHVLLGPNGSGKSTLANLLAGHPKYTHTAGRATLDGTDLLALAPEQRAAKGVFLAFQHPPSIEGVDYEHFLQASAQSRAKAHGEKPLSPMAFHEHVVKAREKVGLTEKHLLQGLNVGFSGGEKKRGEALQLLLAKPRLAILDEIDSGLDVDSVTAIADAVGTLHGPGFSALVITHLPRLIERVKPDRAHVIKDGRIVASGGLELARRVERDGYTGF